MAKTLYANPASAECEGQCRTINFEIQMAENGLVISDTTTYVIFNLRRNSTFLLIGFLGELLAMVAILIGVGWNTRILLPTSKLNNASQRVRYSRSCFLTLEWATPPY